MILANVALAILLAPILGLTQRLHSGASRIEWTGLAVHSASAVLGVWARRHLGPNWSGEIAIKTGHVLVQSGPYGFVRHPIYTALLGMFAGTALLIGKLHAALGFVLAVAAYWRKIGLEEEALMGAMGSAYGEYRCRTRALIPGVL